MGQAVSGTFAIGPAAISFDEAPTNCRNGEVTITIAIDSPTLGPVTAQVPMPEFLNETAFPTTTFSAAILPATEGCLAQGTLTLQGVSVSISLPSIMTVANGVAEMQGAATHDRRDFGIGPSYPDEKSVVVR
jgi:polyisoprenoid-binding protein YceI